MNKKYLIGILPMNKGPAMSGPQKLELGYYMKQKLFNYMSRPKNSF